MLSISQPAPVAQWHKSLAAVHLACVTPRLQRSAFNPRFWRIVGTCRSTKFYSEINISGRHRGSACVLFNLWQAIRTAFKGARAGPLVRASVGITDEAGSGTMRSARPRRNTTYRPSS